MGAVSPSTRLKCRALDDGGLITLVRFPTVAIVSDSSSGPAAILTYGRIRLLESWSSLTSSISSRVLAPTLPHRTDHRSSY